jgi:sulfatase maturation enzyme AslB (radical SAM superfamily)
MKRFFDVYVPIERCNLRCEYCFRIVQQNLSKTVNYCTKKEKTNDF